MLHLWRTQLKSKQARSSTHMSASELEQVRGRGRCSVTRMLHRTATRSHLTDRRRHEHLCKHLANRLTQTLQALLSVRLEVLCCFPAFGVLDRLFEGCGKPEATFWADLLGRFCQIRPT